MQELTIKLESGSLAARVTGSGSAVVLLHAGVADQHMWDAVIPALAEDHTVVTYDLRGFGASSVPAAGFRHTEDLDTLLDALSLKQASLVGASFGGRVAMEFAATRPRRVTALAVLAPPLPGYDWSARMHAYAEAEESALERNDLDTAVQVNLDMWVPAHLAGSVERAMRIALANQTTVDEHELDSEVVLSQVLETITVPTLVVAGESDVDDFQAIARQLGDSIPGAQLVTMPSTGHLIAVERPEETSQLLRDFLRNH